MRHGPAPRTDVGSRSALIQAWPARGTLEHVASDPIGTIGISCDRIVGVSKPAVAVTATRAGYRTLALALVSRAATFRCARYRREKPGGLARVSSGLMVQDPLFGMVFEKRPPKRRGEGEDHSSPYLLYSRPGSDLAGLAIFHLLP